MYYLSKTVTFSKSNNQNKTKGTIFIGKIQWKDDSTLLLLQCNGRRIFVSVEVLAVLLAVARPTDEISNYDDHHQTSQDATDDNRHCIIRYWNWSVRLAVHGFVCWFPSNELGFIILGQLFVDICRQGGKVIYNSRSIKFCSSYSFEQCFSPRFR